MKDLVSVCNSIVRWSYSPVRTRSPQDDSRITHKRYKSKSGKIGNPFWARTFSWVSRVMQGVSFVVDFGDLVDGLRKWSFVRKRFR